MERKRKRKINNEQTNIIDILKSDSSLIIYRPSLNKITGSVNATILLQQIYHRWKYHNHEPFYKFKSPCDHALYKDNDSWCEELGFTESEFDNALKKIATKITKGNKNLGNKAVYYWTNMDRLTFYSVNRKMDLGKQGKEVYVNKETSVIKTRKDDFVYNTKITSKITTNNIYTLFLEFWNKQEIINHSKITSKRKKVIDKILKNKDYSNEEIFQAFKNYATILKSPDYYFTHKWTIEEFLVRGLDRFVSESEPLKTFSNNNNNQSSSIKNDNQSNNNPLDNPTHKSLHLFPVEKIDLFLEEIKTVANKWTNLECWEHGYKPSKFKIYEALLKQKVWLNNLTTSDNLHLVHDDWENRVFNSTVRRNIGTLTQLSSHYFEWLDNEGKGISVNNEQILFPDSKTFKRFILVEADNLGLVSIRSRGWGEDEELNIDIPEEKIQRCKNEAEELEEMYKEKELIEDRTKENIKWAESCIMKIWTNYEKKITDSNWFNKHIADFIGGRKNDGSWKTKLKELFIKIEEKYQLNPNNRKNGYLSSFYNLPEDTIKNIFKSTFIPYEKCYYDLPDRRKIYEQNLVEDNEDYYDGLFD